MPTTRARAEKEPCLLFWFCPAAFPIVRRYIRRARFESDANLLRVAVYTENQDAKVPVLALFTDRHVGKGTELLLSLHAGSNRFMS